MKRWMYDRMVAEYSEKSKEELVQQIMSLEEIELSDRCFANECKAGSAVRQINGLFSTLDELNTDFTKENVEKICTLLVDAKHGWEYITNGIAEMNDKSRCDKALKNFKNRVANAIDKDDNI